MKVVILLPRVPSELLRLAARDMEQAQEDGLILDMGQWYARDELRGRCAVCFAGAAMKYELLDKGVKPTHKEHDLTGAIVCYPQFFPGNEAQLDALNSFRRGFVETGCHRLDRRTRVLDRVMTRPIVDTVRFLTEVRYLATELAAEGN